LKDGTLRRTHQRFPSTALQHLLRLSKWVQLAHKENKLISISAVLVTSFLFLVGRPVSVSAGRYALDGRVADWRLADRSSAGVRRYLGADAVSLPPPGNAQILVD